MIESNKLRSSEKHRMTDFAKPLLAWFDQHGRKDLPWQQDVNPYRVWVSEIMLQQTQVQTVIPYFDAFMLRFPSLKTLADADIDDVLTHWSGLGYYARARNLYRAAQIIRDECDGHFPDAKDAVESLPGIGRSTAGAILALAFEQRQSILDGNVKRVLARYAAIDGWPGQSDVASKLWTLADKHTPTKRVSDYTQAIMDLGATLCTRTKPRCGECPLRAGCVAFKTSEVAAYPGRKPKKDKPRRETIMVMAVAGNAVYMERRPASGIWGGLWSFPELEAAGVEDWCSGIVGDGSNDEVRRENWSPIHHSFSHYDLDIHPVVIRCTQIESSVADSADSTWFQLDQHPPGGIAAPVRKLIDSLRNAENVQNH